MKKSLQQIEDFYVRRGYKKDKLRRILEKDKEYQRLLKQRKNKLSEKINVSSIEKRNYVLSTDIDFIILSKCKELEKLKLSKQDKEIVKLIRTQLKRDWRSPLINYLNKLLLKYKK